MVDLQKSSFNLKLQTFHIFGTIIFEKIEALLYTVYIPKSKYCSSTIRSPDGCVSQIENLLRLKNALNLITSAFFMKMFLAQFIKFKKRKRENKSSRYIEQKELFSCFLEKQI